LSKFNQNLASGYYERAGSNTLTHWLWGLEDLITQQIDTERKLQVENVDCDEVAIARTKLLTALHVLWECVYDFNATVHLESDVEMAENAEFEARATAAESAAAEKLPNRIDETGKAIDDLRRAYEHELNELRLKRQLLDTTLIVSNPI
jgi:hypothetical protein